MPQVSNSRRCELPTVVRAAAVGGGPGRAQAQSVAARQYWVTLLYFVLWGLTSSVGRYPLVDAAMRQLWQVGWMPNYMRHIVAGFLIEFLELDWRHGERWFHDTLVDADVAINAYMWQNGGHSGMDQV